MSSVSNFGPMKATLEGWGQGTFTVCSGVPSGVKERTSPEPHTAIHRCPRESVQIPSEAVGDAEVFPPLSEQPRFGVVTPDPNDPTDGVGVVEQADVRGPCQAVREAQVGVNAGQLDVIFNTDQGLLIGAVIQCEGADQETARGIARTVVGPAPLTRWDNPGARDPFARWGVPFPGTRRWISTFASLHRSQGVFNLMVPLSCGEVMGVGRPIVIVVSAAGVQLDTPEADLRQPRTRQPQHPSVRVKNTGKRRQAEMQPDYRRGRVCAVPHQAS
jgi:hypothetical protein